MEKGLATYSSIFAWEIPWAEEPARLESLGSQRAMTEATEQESRIIISTMDKWSLKIKTIPFISGPTKMEYLCII